MKTYKTSPGVLVLMYFLVVLFFAIVYSVVFGIPGVPQFHEDFARLPEQAALILYIILFLLSILMVCRIVSYHKKKLVIDKDRIYTEGLFESRRELMFYEIVGYWPQTLYPVELLPGLATVPSRIRKRNIVVEAVDKNRKNVLIPKYLEKQQEILGWLERHFTNLEAPNKKERIKELRP